MKLQATVLALFTSLITSEKCLNPPDGCGSVGLPPNHNTTWAVTFYSEPNYKGEYYNSVTRFPFGCSNDMPPYQIKSIISTGSTQVTLHYGKDCVGHVLKQMQGGTENLDTKYGCPGSVLLTHVRYGSC